MSEPLKLAIVLLVLLGIGLVLLAIERAREAGGPWLALMVVSLALLALALGIHFDATVGNTP